MILVTEFNLLDGMMGLNLSFPDRETFDINRKEGNGYIEGHIDGSQFYVTFDGATPRPVFSASLNKTDIKADGQDILTVAGLPIGTTKILLLGTIESAWNETREFTDLTVNVPGHYRIWITQWPYQDKMVEFNAS